MAVDGSLKFDTKIDTNGFKSGTNTIKTQANGLKSVLASLGKAMIVAFSITALINFGKQVVTTTADLKAMDSQFNQVFKGNAGTNALKEMNTQADELGINVDRLKSAYNKFGSQFNSVGQDAATALANTSQATEIAADSAAWMDTSMEAATLSMSSFLKGNYEASDAMGFTSSATQLAQYTLSKYGQDFTKLTEEQKTQMRVNYAMYMQSLSGATGQAARESGSLSNAAGNLSAVWNRLISILGTPILRAVVSVIQAITDKLSVLLVYAQMLANLFPSIFGDGDEAISSVAVNTEDASSGLSDMGKATKKAAKEAKNGTSSFDKLNNMTGDVADNAESAADSMAMMGGGGAYGMDITPTVKAADTSALESGLATAIDNIKTGLSIFLAYLNTSFGPIFSSIWTNLQPPIQTFKTIVAGIFTDLQTLGQPLMEYFVGYLVPGFQTAFTTLGDIAVGLFDTFNMIFSDIWNLAIFPILENFISVGLPMFAEFATLTWETLGVLFDTVKDIFDMLWTDAVAPVIGFISQVWIDLMNTFSDFWDKWGAPIFEGLKTAIQTTGDLFKTIWDTILKPVFDTFMKVADELWTKHLQPLLANFLDLVGEMASGALAIYNKFIVPLVKWFVEKLGPPIAKIISGIIEQLGEWIGSTLDVISNLIKSFKGIIEFLTGVFTGDWEKAWQGIQDIFTGIFEALVIIIKPIINGIIDIINGMIGGIVSGINTVIRSVNSLSFDIPETAFTKAYHVGFNLREFSAQKIPRLATGTVIPPNSEFLAILGDQKSGTNIEAPLDTIVAAFKAVTGQNNGGTSGSNMAHFTIKVGNRVLFDGVVEAEKENYNITGKPVFVH